MRFLHANACAEAVQCNLMGARNPYMSQWAGADIEATDFVIWARKTSNQAVLSRPSEPECSTELKTYPSKIDLVREHAIMRAINLRRGS